MRSALAAACALAMFGAGCWALRTGDEGLWGYPAPQPFEEAAACGDCHSDVAERGAAGVHARKGIRCGQCHRGAGHPDFDQPLDDRTCGGCHQPEYQQIQPHAGEGARPPVACVGCHYDEHRFSLEPVRAEAFCTSCHDDRGGHYQDAEAAGANRCLGCHVRQGVTVTGRVVTSHGFHAQGGMP